MNKLLSSFLLVAWWTNWLLTVSRFDKFSREFSAKYHRKLCKTSSEARNSLENLSLPMIPLALKIVLFLTQSEWSTHRIIYKLPPYSGRAGVGLLFGGSLVWWVSFGGTLVTPVTPFRGGCQPFIQRRCGTRAPLIRKFRAGARVNMIHIPFIRLFAIDCSTDL